MKHKVKSMLENIHKHYGYDLRDYHIDFSVRAVKKEMSYSGISDFTNFSKMLLTDEIKVHSLINRHLISVSDMFKDIEPFRMFREQVIDDLKSYPRIKVWSCGCASGKEVLSLAIILEEEGLYDRAILYATDINQKALATAREATYSIEDVIGFTQNYYLSGGKEDFRKYYTVDWDNNVVHFNKSLLRNIYFSVHNLVGDEVFNEFEVIFCRNVFIYFNKELKARSLGLLKDSLVYRGYLFLGDSENINYKDITGNFRTVDKKHKIYQKSKAAMK